MHTDNSIIQIKYIHSLLESMFENKSKYLFHLKQQIQYENMYSLCVGA